LKKPRISVFVILTVVFAAFTLGFFLGRNYTHGTVSLHVPVSMQTAPTGADIPEETIRMQTEAVQFPLDINTASEQDLQSLPGIGAVLAQRIVAYRQAKGGFSVVEELMNVEGIGEKRMEEILNYITTGG